MKDSGIRSFGQWITQHQWKEVTEAQKTQDKTSAFYTTLNEAVATHFPTKVLRTHLQVKPWISPRIKEAIKRRQRAFCDQKWKTWRALRNKIQRMIKRARNQYYTSRVQKLKKDNPSAWYKEIKVLTGTQKKAMTVQAEGVDPDNHHDMANFINQKFTDVTTSLPPLDLSNLPTYLPSRPPPTVQPWDVYWKLCKIKTTKSAGPDGIDGRLLKEYAVELSEPIANILNSSLLEGRVPHEWKEAVVVPLPKTSPPDINHLRPVSLTSLISKVCEDFVATWMLQDTKNSISPNQFGGLKGRSTTHCLITLANQLYEAADKRGTSSTWVLTDFSKAFDLVHHTVAMKHLINLGVRPEIIPWIVSFHSQRSQRTRYHGALSKKKELTCGLAQGTKLGPIVFIAHVNNLTNSMNSPSRAFVDDLNLVESRRTSEPSKLQNDLDNLSSWTEKNKMKLNPSKCKAVHICFARNPPPPPPLSINGHVLEFAKSLYASDEYRHWLPKRRGDVSGRVMMLQNHGMVACGETIEEAWLYAYGTIHACEIQVQAMGAGMDNLLLLEGKDLWERTAAVAGSEAVAHQTRTQLKWAPGQLEFEAMMRKLDRQGHQTGYPYQLPDVYATTSGQESK
ncbi:ADD3 [Branchiostoma lanceolatum]|uniref:ADD3 protein n=1 Tax=Branchiostoma lanceolatum TaxID=7740 RepID=A0A8K0EPD3_BRALA|nr:ADD3 [Branchiostoma lanceolatum]